MLENRRSADVRQATSTQRLWRIAALLLSYSLAGLAATPVLSFSTFLGGSADERASAVRVDGQGKIYVAGATSSTNFPVSRDAFQPAGPGDGCYSVTMQPTACTSLFVAKFSSDGALLYSTYLGLSAKQSLIAMDIDGAGAVYVAGRFSGPAPKGLGLQHLPGYPGMNAGDVYILKLAPDGASVAYATILPYRSGIFDVRGLAVDAAGTVYVTGGATAGMPTVNAYQPAHNGPVYYTTADSGQTWQPGGAGLPDSSAGVIAIDPRNPQTMYAGYYAAGLYKTTDGGAHWTALLTGGPPDAPGPDRQPGIRGLVIDPSRPDTLYLLANSFSTLYKSTDAGATWKAADSGIEPAVQAIAIDPKNPAVVYAAANGGVYKSTDGAGTWTATTLTNPGVAGPFASAVVVDPKTPGTVYAGTQNGVMKSTDGGATWTAVNTGLGVFDVEHLAIDPVDPRTLYASTIGKVYRTTDAGAHWTEAQWPQAASGDITAIAFLFDPLVHTTVWAATNSGVLVSRDGGATWTAPGAQLPPHVVRGIAASSAGVVYALADSPSLPDAFVMKLDPTGSRLVYSTFLGGSGEDTGAGIAVDNAGRAYIGGTSDSLDLPGASGAQSRNAGDKDAFVAVLDATGRLAWSTYLGGSGEDDASAIAVDTAGNIHVTGFTASHDFPLRLPSQPALKGRTDAFAAKIKGDGSALLFSSYMGVGGEFPDSVASDSAGNTYISGTSYSTELPVTVSLQWRTLMPAITFIAAWDDSSGALQLVTYLGGTGGDGGSGIAVDLARSVYVAGTTAAPELPHKYAFQDSLSGVSDGFVAKISTTGIAPRMSLSAAVDAASYGPTVAPGELAALFGTNLALSSAQAGGFPLPGQLADLKAMVNGVAAPLYYVSPFQVNLQIPYETVPGPAQIQATSTGGTATVQVQVAATAPVIFTLDASGSGPGAMQHGLTYEVVSNANPASAGETVAIYCTGLGAVDPAVATGAAAGLPLSYTREPAKVSIGGVAAEVTYSGLTPGLAGLYQVNARVPSGLAPGAQPVQMTVGSAHSNIATLSVR